MNKHHKFSLVFIFFFSFIILSSCTKEGEETLITNLKVTINSWIGWAPLYLALDKNFFEKDNVNLELIRVEDTGVRKSTMLSGKVDGYASSVDNFALDSSQGVPGTIVLAFDESHGGDGIVSKKSIKTVSDLKGKEIAFQPGLPGHFLLLHVLNEAGLKEKDIQKIDMDSDKAGSAFTSGKLDAAVTWEPWLSKSQAMSDGHILLTTKDFPGLIVDVLVFREDVLANKSKAVKTVLRSWFQSLKYWNENPKESNEIMAKAYGLPVEEFEAMVSGVKFYDYKKNMAYLGGDKPGHIFTVFNQAAGSWKDNNLIRGSVAKAEEKIDPTYLRNLYNE